MCVRIVRSLFSVVIDPLVTRPVFLREKLLPEGEFPLGIRFFPAVFWSFRPCAAKHRPGVLPLGNEAGPQSEEGLSLRSLRALEFRWAEVVHG